MDGNFSGAVSRPRAHPGLAPAPGLENGRCRRLRPGVTDAATGSSIALATDGMSPPSRTLGGHFSGTRALTDTRGRGYHRCRRAHDATPSIAVPFPSWRLAPPRLPARLRHPDGRDGAAGTRAEGAGMHRGQAQGDLSGRVGVQGEGCGPPETFICVSYQGWVCTKEGAGQSSRRVLGMVATLAARSAAEIPAPPMPLSVPEPPVPSLYVPPPPPPPPTF
jgi:hypothetical protein